jgi:hypothetical protein
MSQTVDRAAGISDGEQAAELAPAVDLVALGE